LIAALTSATDQSSDGPNVITLQTFMDALSSQFGQSLSRDDIVKVRDAFMTKNEECQIQDQFASHDVDEWK
jgi:hypothetical protein